ncbi:MAG: acyl-CoA dehydrogenase family protein [Dehalococcoidia bacterium]|nr:acyl-CoA dehydrogenase family protein [Dehalococcoidia bacterium]
MDQPERLQGRIYHDWLLPEETRAIRAEMRRFVDDEVLPVAGELNTVVESREAFPTMLFRRMAEDGVFALPFSVSDGGRGLHYPLSAATVAMEELAYASDGLATIFDDHCVLPGIAMLHASESLKAHYLAPLIDGSAVACMAITEPEAGSDLRATTIKTRAVEHGEYYVVNGHKRFITNAPVGDFMTTLCVVDDAMAMLVVDLHAEGVTVGPPDLKTGNRVQLTADVWLRDAMVPKSNLVGARGDGLRIALAALTWGRVLVGVSGVAMAQAALDECIHFMRNREMFGGRLSDMQHWQFLLAERATQITMARDLCYKAALRYDEGDHTPEPETAMAKYYGTQVAGDMARDAVQVFGGLGFITRLGADGSTCRVEQLYRDCKVAEIYEGTNEIQKRVIARTAFGREHVR